MTEKQQATRLNEALEDLLALARSERDTRDTARRDSAWSRAFRRINPENAAQDTAQDTVQD